MFRKCVILIGIVIFAIAVIFAAGEAVRQYGMYKSFESAYACVAKDDCVGLEELLDEGVQPDARRPSDDMPLLINAVGNKAWRCVDVLLGRGADVNVAYNGLKAINYAEDRVILERLLRDEDCRVSQMDVALLYQGWIYHPEIARLLIQRGFNPKERVSASSRNTVLMMIALICDRDIASQRKAVETMKVFIDAGADISAESKHGATVTEIARAKNKEYILENLLKP